MTTEDRQFVASALLSMARMCAREIARSKRRDKLGVKHESESLANIDRLQKLAMEIIENER